MMLTSGAMSRARPAAFFVLVTCALGPWTAGCNALLGIREGEPEGGGAGAGAGGGATVGGTAGAGAGGSSVICPPDKPDTCDPAYLTDPDNCCLAGRSCQGGECANGVCASAFHGQTVQGGEAIGVARSGDLVVWSGGWERSILRSDTDGDGFALVLGGAQHDFNYVTMIAADPDPGGYVFFTDYAGSRIGRVSIETGAFAVLAEVPPAVVPGAEARWGRILVHGDHVYWTMDFQASNQAGEQIGKHIWRAPREPDSFPAEAEMVVETTGAFGLAADDEHLYFGRSELGSIERLAFADIGQKDGSGNVILGPTEVLALGQGYIGHVAVDDENVYWAVSNEVRYQKKDVKNGTIQSVFGLDSYVWGVESDGRDIYITTVGDSSSVQGALWRVPVGQAVSPERLYTTESAGDPEYKSVYSLTQDCDTVYFLIPNGGKVRRVTK